ncbi:MAG: hypothetical protein C0501_01450 [Isosphaera sp.]|nr:hypothetical protein [Isosphaera sp.]
MSRTAPSAGLVLAALSWAPPAAAQPAPAPKPFDDLLKHVTANTNVLALLDVKAAYASPLAKAEKWAEKGQPGNRGGLGFVPADAEAVVVAAEVNLSSIARDFQVGLVKVREMPGMKQVAQREGGTTDEIAGRLAALSPRDVYFTSLSGTELVAVYPADRQYTARFLKAALAGKTGQYSDYLKAAVGRAGGNTVTIAVDLEDVVDRTILRLTLPASPAVNKVKTADVNQVATFLSTVKGMTFAAQVTDGISGSITVEFGGDPTAFRKTLPDLFRELLEGQGMAIPAIDRWEAAFTDRTMTLSGPLATADLKRVVSLFAFPSPAGEAEAGAKAGEPTAGATRRYLQAVDVILADVRALRDSPSYDKTATWHDRAAAQIEHLSRQGVDPVAGDAGYQAARRLRAIGSSLRGVPIDLNALSNQQYTFTTGGGYGIGGVVPGWWGWRPYIQQNPSFTQTNVPKIQAEMQKVIADDQKRRLEAWAQIDSVLVDARKKLADKYKEGF